MSDIWEEKIGSKFLPSKGTYQAAAYAFVGMALLGFIDNFVKVVAQEIGLWQFHFSRSVMVLSVLLPVALALGWRLRPENLGGVALRSLCVATSMILYFGSVAVLPIAQVGAGLFTAPIFVVVISVLFYGMQVRRIQLLAIVLGFAGVVLMLRPDAGSFTAFSLIPVLAGLCYGFGAVCTRVYCAGESTATLVVGFFVVLGLWGAGGLGYYWITGAVTDPKLDGFFGAGWQNWTDTALFWVFAQGAVSLFGIACITRAYQIAEASRVAVFEYAFLISAGLWAYLLWGEVLDAAAFVGMGLIVLAGIVILTRNEDSVAA